MQIWRWDISFLVVIVIKWLNSQILKVSDRSIERDKKAIREANALSADPELVEQMIGRLVCEAELVLSMSA